tara:strand:- start:1141 stop:2514 length:1374 start_codon:yes stop_codon:yes gene_type:complete
MIKKKNIPDLFILFLLAHLIIWTFVPALTNTNLPLDTIEALAWGSNLEWGFNKHPPMSAFMVEIFYKIFGTQDWAYYFLSQIFVITGFFAVYKLSEEFFKNKSYSLLSVLLLEGIYFYNFTTPEFNVNVCQIPFWALSVYFTWRCIKFDRIMDYVFLGLFIGFGILSKYLFIYLVVGIKLLFIYFAIKGKKIKFRNYFIAGPIALIILLPHIFWLIENNYETITYGLQRTGGVGGFLDHLIYPIIFLLKQTIVIAPIFLMIFFLIKKIKFKINYKDEKIVFLFFTTLMPLLLILLTSIIMGAKIRTMWMTPFYLFFGVLLVYLFQKTINLNRINEFLTIFLFLFIISPLLYLFVSISEKDKRTDYPGKEIAYLVQDRWDKNFVNEISIVVGDEWSGGNLSYHLKSRPKWFNNLDENLKNIDKDAGFIYIGNPEVLKKICPGVYGTIKPMGICMLGKK